MKKSSSNRFPFALAWASLGLSLCATATVVAQTESPSTLPPDRESPQPGTDAIITGKVKAELMTTQGVPATRIEVSTQNGTVILSGMLDSKDQVQKAVDATKSVRGVHEVNSIALKSKE